MGCLAGLSSNDGQYYDYDVDFGQTHVPLGKPVLGRKAVYVPLDPVVKLNVSQYSYSFIFYMICLDLCCIMLGPFLCCFVFVLESLGFQSVIPLKSPKRILDFV